MDRGDGSLISNEPALVCPGLVNLTVPSRRQTAPSRWKLARLGRTLVHLVNITQDLSARGVGLRVLTGQGAQIDTSAR